MHHSLSITTTASLAIALLITVGGIQLGKMFRVSEPSTTDRERPSTEEITTNADREWIAELTRLGIVSTPGEPLSTSTDPVQFIGEIIADQTLNGYLSLKQSGLYSPEEAARVGEQIGANIAPAPTAVLYRTSSLATTADTSPARVITYRGDMRDALSPLVTDEEDELTLFARYLDTLDRTYLERIRASSERYKIAEMNMATIIVPEDGVEVHLRTLNALVSFRNTLERLVLFSDSSLSSLALLRTYNEAEREMLYAFDALARYYVESIDQ